MNCSVLLQRIMSPFRIQNVYLREADDASDTESEFEISSDMSDTKLLKLQQNLKKLNSKKMQHNLTDTMIVLQISVMK